ncbi:unnamed protein product [Pelagomonas calceolata]|uniref:Uncharacterized protein n=2 Tax=Pelagomonas calceolata TaxID=35677 RepID=A0A7S4A3Y9_9STRA|nr:unnamed protein product [Pelagomonas calceolata]|mmetsp:Transcript_5576/g.15680  ORF Transcript_5576/g.15680 Transcript_5576/m.15680 type:complete len:324 (-) Transcript_5576:28-999(-)
MAEVGSIRGGDGSIPGEEVEIKKEPQFLQPLVATAVLSAMAPTRGFPEINDLRRLVLAAEPTKTYTIPSQVEPKYTCDVCGNRDQTKFLHESKDGDVVCLGIGDQGCGNVVEEHKLFEGNQFRKFEGEEDKSHHGPAPNKLYSAAHNMKTSLVPTGGAGGQRASRLRQASETMEMGLSNLGTDERKTRTGYKDQMKKKAFDLIAHAASNLNLHDSVVGRAQELFANYRDEREFVQKFDGVVAACVIQAAEESARDALGASEADAAPVIPKPTVVSRTQQLLMRPVATQKRKASGSAPAPKRAARAGKSWLDDLGDIEEEDSDS